MTRAEAQAWTPAPKHSQLHVMGIGETAMRTFGGAIGHGALAGAILAAGLATGAGAEISTAVRHEDRAVAGLAQPAEIIVDRWGIPHIYAKTSRDAFFLQG